MKYNIIPVQTPKATDARLYTYILDNFEEIDSNRTRPAGTYLSGRRL